MFSLKLAFKNILARKSSFVIILFICFAIALLVVCNAIFNSTGSGIKNTFISSFTGDVVIRPKAEFPLSLFGDETPLTGALSEIPFLVPYEKTAAALKNSGLIEISVPQITGQVLLSAGDARIPMMAFGVDAKNYFSAMNGIHITEGTPYADGQKGLMLSESAVCQIENSTGEKVHCGDTIQLISGSGSSFNMRSIPVTGIYAYPVHNEILDRIILVSPDTERELCSMISVSADSTAVIDTEEKNLLESDADIDSLFNDRAASVSPDTAAASNIQQKDAAAAEAETCWNFIVCRTVPGVSPDIAVRRLNRLFKTNGWDIQAVNWRAAAGLSAMYLYWMRLIFNIGIIVILGTGLIVINNTLVISALDRIHETGTLRAVGAERGFVAGEFLLETLLLTICAGVIGCMLGYGIVTGLSGCRITLHNTYLIQLFGGETLTASVSAGIVVQCMGLSLVLAVIGWLYPAHIALETSPVEAMQGQH